MTRLMGVRVRDAALSPGEGWAPGLAKLRVSEADGALLGTVYLDFQPRPGKFPGAAHFVLRCGRGHGTDAVQVGGVRVMFSEDGVCERDRRVPGRVSQEGEGNTGHSNDTATHPPPALTGHRRPCWRWWPACRPTRRCTPPSWSCCCMSGAMPCTRS